MENEKRKELMGRLQKGAKPFEIAIVDDNGEEIGKQIKSEIECYFCNMRLQNALNYDWLDEYDLIFFDATYREDGLQSIDIMERLLENKPEFRQKTIALMGNDIKEYGRKSGDVEMNILIDRVNQLPNIVYGDGRGSKIEKMIRCIQREGRKKGIEIPKRLPKGTCGGELLGKVNPYIETFIKILEEEKSLIIDLKSDLEGFNPSNEHERRIIANAKEIERFFIDNYHKISQQLGNMDRYCKKAENKPGEEVNGDKNIDTK